MPLTISDLRARLSPARPAQDTDPLRTAFEGDIDRITFSEAFRLLADKTQVHGPNGQADTRSRLTHSLEVSRVARSLGMRLAALLPGEDARRQDVADIVQAAALLHDIGNPPFGHTGERVMSEFFRTHPLGRSLIQDLAPVERTQFTHIEGNAQALRFALRLGGWRAEGGLCLTAATLAAFAKYPWTADPVIGTEARYHKYGIHAGDRDVFAGIAQATGTPAAGRGWVRHPLAYLSEAADDICYNVVDLEDAARLQVVKIQEVEDLLLPLLAPAAAQSYRSIEGRSRKLAFLRSQAISTLVEAVTGILPDALPGMMDGTYPGALCKSIPQAVQMERIQAFSRRYIYCAPSQKHLEGLAETTLTGILATTAEVLLQREQAGHPIRHPALDAMEESPPYTRLDWLYALCDHMTRQTDHSVQSLYQALHPV